jgi:hypothetical protein
MKINDKKITLPNPEKSDIISSRKGDDMNYAKNICQKIFDGIDDTLYACMLQAGEKAAVEADVMGMILKRELTQYTDDAVRRVKEALKGGERRDKT